MGWTIGSGIWGGMSPPQSGVGPGKGLGTFSIKVLLKRRVLKHVRLSEIFQSSVPRAYATHRIYLFQHYSHKNYYYCSLLLCGLCLGMDRQSKGKQNASLPIV